ncbi:MAG: hypothetical protein EOP01_03475, partial [Propionibacteriaceae bacterium]
PADPHLYDLTITLLDADGAEVDTVETYAGLRSVSLDGHAVLLNGEPVFQRLVLDQGYYPDGLMTAPSDEALVRDIELAMAAGFNGARLHQKVFEERFLFHADRLGYLVWGEFGDWGAAERGTQEHGEFQRPTPTFVAQWLEALERDHSHPSIVGWCGLNETYQEITDRGTVLDDVTRAMFLAAKAMDTSRPVLDASGYSHRVAESDVWDSHNYTQDPAQFAREMAGLAQGRPDTNTGPAGQTWSLPYGGQPWFCSEFGGIWWRPDAAASNPEVDRGATSSWGYGEPPRSEEEFHHRFEGLTGVLLDDPRMFGYCYTQLTDVFQEQNGVYSFDRSEKLIFEVAEQKLEMECTYETGAGGDVVSFKRAGASGQLLVAPEQFELHAKLGMLLGMFRGRIESEIVRNLDDLLAQAQPLDAFEAGLAAHEAKRAAKLDAKREAKAAQAKAPRRAK